MYKDKLCGALLLTALFAPSIVVAQEVKPSSPKPILGYALWLASEPGVPPAHLEQRRNAFAALHNLRDFEITAFKKVADILSQRRSPDSIILASEFNTAKRSSNPTSEKISSIIAEQDRLLSALIDGLMSTLTPTTLEHIALAAQGTKPTQ